MKTVKILSLLVLIITIVSFMWFSPKTMFANFVRTTPTEEEVDELQLADIFSVENDRFVLSINSLSGVISLTDKKTGAEWSTPDVSQAGVTEFLARGVASPFHYEYTRISSWDTRTTTFAITPEFYTHASGTVEIFQEPEGFFARYDIAQREIKVAIRYILSETGLIVEIPNEGIEEYGDFSLVSLRPLPYFGAGLDTDEGFVFYPDGSGALSYFKENHPSYNGGFEKHIYCEDDIFLNETIYDMVPQVMLPVFGIEKNGAGFASYITQGAENALICYYPSGFQMNVYRANFKFIYRYVYMTALANTRLVPFLESELSPIDISLRYDFTEAGTGYNGMAAAYRNYLTGNNLLPDAPQNIPGVNIDFLMGIVQDGLLLNKYIPMTTFNQARDILDDLQGQGAGSLSAVLMGWTSQGHNRAPINMRPARQLGGAGDMRSLAEYTNANGITLYAQVNLLDAHAGGLYFSRKDIAYQRNSILPITNKADTRFLSNIASNTGGSVVTVEGNTRFLFNPRYIRETLAKRLESRINGINLSGIMYERIGSVMYADYNRTHGNFRREETVGIFADLLASSGAAPKTGVVGGNLYALSSADRLAHIPFTDSGYFFGDEIVPFYQMVIHGSIPYTGRPINQYYDIDAKTLKMIEYGYIPNFVLTYQDSIELIETTNNEIFSSHYSLFADKIVQVSEWYEKELHLVASKQMTGHKNLSNGVYATEYAGNITIYVNYNETERQADGHNIPALGYLMVIDD